MMVDINNSKSLPADDVEALAENKSVSVSVFRAAGSFSAGTSWDSTAIRAWRSSFEPGKIVLTIVDGGRRPRP